MRAISEADKLKYEERSALKEGLGWEWQGSVGKGRKDGAQAHGSRGWNVDEGFLTPFPLRWSELSPLLIADLIPSIVVVAGLV